MKLQPGKLHAWWGLWAGSQRPWAQGACGCAQGRFGPADCTWPPGLLILNARRPPGPEPLAVSPCPWARGAAGLSGRCQGPGRSHVQRHQQGLRLAGPSRGWADLDPSGPRGGAGSVLQGTWALWLLAVDSWAPWVEGCPASGALGTAACAFPRGSPSQQAVCWVPWPRGWPATGVFH